MEWKFCGDGRETGWRRAVMEMTSAVTGGDGCSFCRRAALYSWLF